MLRSCQITASKSSVHGQDADSSGMHAAPITKQHELESRPLDERSVASVCVLVVLEVLMAAVQSI